MKIHFLITAQNQFLINRNTTQWHNTHFFYFINLPFVAALSFGERADALASGPPSRFGCGCRGNSSCSPFDVGAASGCQKRKAEWDAGGGA